MFYVYFFYVFSCVDEVALPLAQVAAPRDSVVANDVMLVP